MGLLFRKQVHNSLFAQFCPNFLMLRNCYKSASHSFYGYFPTLEQFSCEKEAIAIDHRWSFHQPMRKKLWYFSFHRPMKKKLVYCFFTNQWGKKLTLRRAGQIETTESSSKQSVQLALCVCGAIMVLMVRICNII